MWSTQYCDMGDKHMLVAKNEQNCIHHSGYDLVIHLITSVRSV